MVTEIILVIFAILYYLFSVFFCATLIQEKYRTFTWVGAIVAVIITMAISPIVTPVILGIELGEWISNNN